MNTDIWISAAEASKILGIHRDRIRNVMAHLPHQYDYRTSCRYNVKCAKLGDIIEALRKQDERNASLRFGIRISKRIGRGRYIKLTAIEIKNYTLGAGWATIIDLERKLNNGMLADEAESVYPRMGWHNHEVFRVSIASKKEKEGF
jgi:hypothetical protein